MGGDCPLAGLPPRSDARSGLSVTLATGSGELADDPAHRVRDAATKTGSDAFIRPQHDGGGERVRMSLSWKALRRSELRAGVEACMVPLKRG